MPRLDVRKTYKLYIGGKFPRSESGRYLPAKSPRGEHLDNFAHASRKDFRDAV
ncbi:MAG TPA: aldehyde dehydrogenase, partial [Verrucomicrobiae bacterium]